MQLKDKRKQLFLKTTSEGRQRAKQKRHEEELERERRNQEDEVKRLYVLRQIHIHMLCLSRNNFSFITFRKYFFFVTKNHKISDL